MKKFLVLGIGNAQVDLLQYLSGRFEVHALSNSKQGRGLPYADFFTLIDITNKEEVLQYVKTNKIDYIYSIGSDVAMPTVAWVAEKAGLPSMVSYDTANSCNTKNIFREKLKNSYGSVPFQLLENNGELSLELPIIVKPVDSQGQRGVSTVEDKSELEQAYKFAIQYTRSKQVIAEKKIIGEEISVNAYIINKELYFYLPSDRISWGEFDGGVIHKHLVPAKISNIASDNVKRLVTSTIEKLSIDNGPVYFQIMMDKDTPYLIEVTARFDGCHMWNLIHHTTGLNLLELTIDHLTNGNIVPSIHDFDVKGGVLEFFCSKPNIPFNLPAVDHKAVHSEIYLKQGDMVPEMNGKMEKCGYQILVQPK